MGEFDSDDHHIYHCGQETLRRNGVAIIVKKKSSKWSTWMQSQKWQNVLGLFPKKTIHNIVIQVYDPASDAEEAEVERF